MKNMIRHHTSAITIQSSSTRSSGSFHHTRSEGGRIALIGDSLFRDRQVDDLHHAPDRVQDGRDRDADEQQQERVVEQLLHRRNRILQNVIARYVGVCHETPSSCAIVLAARRARVRGRYAAAYLADLMHIKFFRRLAATLGAMKDCTATS